MFVALLYALAQRCRDLTPKHSFKFKNPLHSIDATTFDLCLSAFPWTKFRKTKGAISSTASTTWRGAPVVHGHHGQQTPGGAGGAGFYAEEDYPDTLRRFKFGDEEEQDKRRYS